ncbi:MAG: hypothetical protein AAFZ63_17535 [Bacteroidota bacterium]
MKLDTLIGVGHGDFNATLDGKRLEELAFEFILQPTKLVRLPHPEVHSTQSYIFGAVLDLGFVNWSAV